MTTERQDRRVRRFMPVAAVMLGLTIVAWPKPAVPFTATDAADHAPNPAAEAVVIAAVLRLENQPESCPKPVDPAQKCKFPRVLS